MTIVVMAQVDWRSSSLRVSQNCRVKARPLTFRLVDRAAAKPTLGNGLTVARPRLFTNGSHTPAESDQFQLQEIGRTGLFTWDRFDLRGTNRHRTNLKTAPTDSLLLSPPSIHGLLAYRTARILTERKQTQHDQQKYNN
jgi:hypothetical protein